MQPSRMFNHSTMHQAELLREASAMRLADQAAAVRTSTDARRVSPLGSLAYRIANWRRLSARRLFGDQDVVWQSQSPQPSKLRGTLTTAD